MKSNIDFVGVFHSAEKYGYSKNNIYRRIQKTHAFKALLSFPLLLLLIWAFLLIYSLTSAGLKLI